MLERILLQVSCALVLIFAEETHWEQMLVWLAEHELFYVLWGKSFKNFIWYQVADSQLPEFRVMSEQLLKKHWSYGGVNLNSLHKNAEWKVVFPASPSKKDPGRNL